MHGLRMRFSYSVRWYHLWKKCTFSWLRPSQSAWKLLSAFSELLYSLIIFIIRKSKWCWETAYLFYFKHTCMRHMRHSAHKSTQRYELSCPPFFFCERSFVFLDLVKQGTKLYTPQPCVYPACESSCQDTDWAVMSKNQYFVVLSQFKSEM